MQEKFPKAIEIIKKYDNHYSRRDKLKTLFGSKESAGAALWELDRQGKGDFAYEAYLSLLCKAPKGSFAAKDLVGLLNRISASASRVQFDIDDDEVEGWGFYFDIMLDKVIEEPKPLLKALKKWSKPLRTGASYALARRGVLPVDDLAPDILGKAARATVNGCHYEKDIEELLKIWPRPIVGKALAKAAAHEEAELWRTVFLSVAEEHATAEQLVAIAANTYHESEVEACTAMLERHGDKVEAKVRQFIKGKPDTIKRNGHFVFGMFLCRQVKKRGEKAGETIINLFSKHLRRANPRFIAVLAKDLEVLPPKALSALIRSVQDTKIGFMLLSHWYDEKVLAHAIEVIKEWGRGDNWTKTAALQAFGQLKADATPLLLQALDEPCPHRDVFIRGLGAAGTDESFPRLIELLADSSKTAAIEANAALTLNGEKASRHLINALTAKKKAIRLGAADLLRKLESNKEIVVAAKKALEKEKASEVRELLQEIVAAQEEQTQSTKTETPLTKIAKLREQSKNDQELDDLVKKILAGKECSFSTDHIGPLLVRLHDMYIGQKLGAFSSTWLTICRQVGEKDIAPWLTTSLFAHCQLSFTDKKYGAYNEDLSCAENLFSDDLKPPLLYQLMKDRDNPNLVEMLSWYIESGAEDAYIACVKTLENDDGQIRKISLSALKKAPPRALKHLYPLLQAKKARTRQLTIEVLESGHFADNLDLKVLRKALKAERSAKLKTRLDSLLFKATQPDINNLVPSKENHKKLDAKLAKQGKNLPADLEMDKVASLCWSSGLPMSPKARDSLLTQMALLGPKKKDHTLEALRHHLEPTSMAAFILSIEEQYHEVSRERTLGWVLFSCAIFGNDETALKLGRYLDEEARYGSSQSAFYRLEVLRRLATPTALIWIDKWARKARSKKLKSLAQSALQQIGGEKGMTPDELSERVMASFDFDLHGRKKLAYGSRELNLVLTANNKVTVQTEEGKTLRRLPAAKKEDDLETIKAIKKEVTKLKKEVKQVTTAAIFRLENGLVLSRRWLGKDFKETYLSNPLLANLAKNILWQRQAEGKQSLCFFRIDDTLDMATIEDEAMELDDKDIVSIAHPMHLSAIERKKWQNLFFDYELIPPFEQLNRQVYTLAADEAEDIEIQRFDTIDFPTSYFRYHFENRGWTRGAPQDGGAICDYSKAAPSANLVVYLSFNPGHSVSHQDDFADSQQISTLRFLRKGVALKLKEVPAVLFSEITRELDLLRQKVEQNS